MRHFFKKHWVVLAAFALSFLLTVFISPEDAVIAQSTVSDTSKESGFGDRNISATEFKYDRQDAYPTLEN